MNYENPMGTEFSVLDISFYTNLTSILNNSIYAFSSTDSMMLFKDTGNKLEKNGSVRRSNDGQYLGVPLFQCLLKKDLSFMAAPESMNYKIYKFIIIPGGEKSEEKAMLENRYLKDRENKFVCFNQEHNISIYKILYSEVKSKKEWLSLTKLRRYILKFRNEQMTMLYRTFNDYVEVSGGPFANSRWVYNDNYGNVVIDGFFINSNYKLFLSDGSVACEFDDRTRSNKWIIHTKSEKMGLLRFANYNKPPEFSTLGDTYLHNNDYLTDFNEYAICMTFVLINHRRYAKDDNYYS